MYKGICFLQRILQPDKLTRFVYLYVIYVLQKSNVIRHSFLNFGRSLFQNFYFYNPLTIQTQDLKYLKSNQCCYEATASCVYLARFPLHYTITGNLQYNFKLQQDSNFASSTYTMTPPPPLIDRIDFLVCAKLVAYCNTISVKCHVLTVS